MKTCIFSGQGSQKRGMGKSLFPKYSSLIKDIDNILGYSIEELCCYDPDGKLNQTEFTQPAIYVVNALNYFDTKPENITSYLGHSLGEYNALLAAGAFDFLTGLELVKKRGQLMNQVQGGGMMAIIGLDCHTLEAHIAQSGLNSLCLANINTHEQMVIAGWHNDLIAFKALLESLPAVKACVMLKTSGPFHSWHMTAAAEAFSHFVREQTFCNLSTPVISNVTARPYPQNAIPDLLVKQLTHQVLWTDSIQYLSLQGCHEFHEMGESRVVSGMVDSFLASQAMEIEKARPSLYLTQLLDQLDQACYEALIYLDEQGQVVLTSQQLQQKIMHLGAQFCEQFKQGHQLVLLLPLGPEFVISLLACWYAGLTAVLVPVISNEEVMQKQKDIAAMLADLDECSLLCEAEIEDTVRSFFPEHTVAVIEALQQMSDTGRPPRTVEPSSLALLLYTSGSTSTPKGVMLSHCAIASAVNNPAWQIEAGDKVFSWLPQYHAFGLYLGLLAPLIKGVPSVITSPSRFIRSPALWFESIEQFQITHTAAPNFAFDFCTSHLHPSEFSPTALASLKAILCGGDIICWDSCQRFSQKFNALGIQPHTITPHYGLSEVAPVSQQPQASDLHALFLDPVALAEGKVSEMSDEQPSRKIVSVGVPVPGCEVCIVDPETGGKYQRLEKFGFVPNQQQLVTIVVCLIPLKRLATVIILKPGIWDLFVIINSTLLADVKMCLSSMAKITMRLT
ncbi:AMP-binding protein [Motilimonas cestriensis]|uniref:AMP-binding protein n=1 Tax=Motilimonas cestriensis TaxID=2742685 RepID=UPI003DA1D220